MIINKVVKKKWGRERWIVNNFRYCGKIMFLENHWQCSFHFHLEKHETFHILDGTIYFKYKETEFMLQKGQTIVIEPGIPHSFGGIAIYGSQILEISTEHKEEDSYRYNESHQVNGDEFLRWTKLPVYDYTMIDGFADCG
jgi:mannose-6-phosphate isomerase-like protein (cupin superfamily)